VSRANYLFTSESVSEGHPDKVCDRISDAVVDLYLAADPYARVAIETLVTTNRIVMAGEVRGPESVTPELIEQAARQKTGQTVNVLTHCNAGWLACVDRGTALAPIYAAHDRAIPIHVWVDETRPRNQGAALTAYELGAHGVPHTIVVDNAGGHLMQRGMVDLAIVGTDRVTGNGDVANKIGTYLKALAAHDNGVPFYVALPSPTIDWAIDDGDAIPIEPIAEGGLERWLARQRAPVRSWIAANRFLAKPGQHLLIPDAEGRIGAVALGVQAQSGGHGRDIWSYGGLPLGLPEATYRLPEDMPAAAATAAGLGWALGGYGFTRYKKPEREPARTIV
jgi:hypothetical protein